MFITDKYREHGVWAVRNLAEGGVFIWEDWFRRAAGKYEASQMYHIPKAN
jgi:hypothetical protein